MVEKPLFETEPTSEVAYQHESAVSLSCSVASSVSRAFWFLKPAGDPGVASWWTIKTFPAVGTVNHIPEEGVTQ
jgi:hypothetical protein